MARLLRPSRHKKRKKSRWSLWCLVATGLCCALGFLFVMYRKVDVESLSSRMAFTETPLTPLATKTKESTVLLGKQIREQPKPSTAVSKPLQSTTYQYNYQKYFEPKGIPVSPWTDWSNCDMTTAFERTCHPRPATCTEVTEDIHNNHGIGNALITSYIKKAGESLLKSPDCAPILKDRLMKADKPHLYNFKLLDYVQEPNVVLDVTAENINLEATKKCITYAITQPRDAVADKIKQVTSKFEHYEHLPLVALHLRTGWSDENQRNANGWKALGNCKDYPLDMNMVPHAVNEVNLTAVALDTAHAADQMFGKKQWRLYVASDAPGARRYVQHILQDRTPSPIVWNPGRVGHNYLGGQITNKQEKIETSISAFTDVLIMSQADLLVSLSSKFPRAAEMRATCPQRAVHLPGHPRHGLAKTGQVLSDALKRDARRKDGEDWIPELNDEMKKNFWEGLPEGRGNPCAKAVDPIRSCYCMLKQGHG